ncbi:piggyBac transposable element-derived protein 4 [Trichonephila clavipes]|nr:piggyBac transposable element-derived protein 4 [Trichonephila clavipes]
MHVKHVDVKSPHVGVMWKFGRGVISSATICLSNPFKKGCLAYLKNEWLIEERSSDGEFSFSESESDDDCLDSDRDWCQIDVTSPLPSHPKLTFTGNPGIKVCIGDSGDPLEYFNLFLDDEMFSFIVEETNRYAESFFENAELTPGSRALKWKNTNKEEMKRFISLLRLQGIVQKPVEQWFWSKRPILSTPFFGKVMVHKFKSVYVPKPDISVDESLIAYKGRLSWKQYIPQKRARFGIKLFQLCESESGYIWNSLIYTGKGTAFKENYNDYGLSTKSVLTLIHELKGKNYCLSTDNFYTSPELAELLIDSKTDICGTLRPNRKGLPVSLKSSTLKKGEDYSLPKGDEAHFWLNGYDNKQNCRIWSEANPQVYVETPLHPEELTV